MRLFTQIPLLFLYNSYKRTGFPEVIYPASPISGSGTVSNPFLEAH